MLLFTRYLAPALLLAAGEAAGFALMRFSRLWTLLLPLPVLTVLIGHGCSLRGWKAAVFFLTGLLLMFRFLDGRHRFLKEEVPVGRPLEASLTVIGEPRVGAKGWVSFDSAAGGVDLRVIFRPEPDAPLPAVGEIWRCAGWIDGGRGGAGLSGRRNLWVRGRGTFARRHRAASGWRARCAAVRRDLSRRIGLGLDARPEAADLNRAILLGERTKLPRATRDLFTSAGTLHVFSVSGLHVVLIAGVLRFLLTLLFIPFRLSAFLLVPILWGYVLTIGAPPSAVRAAAMASLCCLAPVVWRRSDGLAAWSLTFIAVHTLRPAALLDVGSLLSFTVMLGILLFLKWAEAFGEKRSIGFFGVSFAAWAAGVPIVACAFGTLTPGGLLANLLLLPAANLSVAAGAAGALASYLSPWAAAHINNAAALFTDAMVGISWAVSRLPGAHFRTPAWRLWECAAWYAVILLAFWLARAVILRRRRTL